ncbi:MAG: 50S ribosomal protein L10 [bacterium]
MPKTRSEKEEVIKGYSEKLNNVKSVAIADFQGLTVKEVDGLRKKCRQSGLGYLVAKKTLLALALKEKGLEILELSKLHNNVGVVFGSDEISPAKVFSEYAKEHEEKFNLAVGILDGKIINSSQVKYLANLPSKEELLGKMLGSINAPVSNFVRVLQGNIRGLVQVLNAIKENK